MAERRPMTQPNLCVHFFQSRKPQLLQKWSRNWSRRDEILTKYYFVIHLLYFLRKRRKKYLPMSQYFWLIYGKLCGFTGFFNPMQEKNKVLNKVQAPFYTKLQVKNLKMNQVLYTKWKGPLQHFFPVTSCIPLTPCPLKSGTTVYILGSSAKLELATPETYHMYPKVFRAVQNFSKARLGCYKS